MDKPKNVRDIPTRQHPWKIVAMPDYGEPFIWSVYSSQKKALKYAEYLSTRNKRTTFRIEKHLFL